MNKKRIIPAALLLLSIVVYIYFFIFGKPLSPPQFSHVSGFYEKEFCLEITAPAGCTVYYTLDGSCPDENSFVYNEPLLIKNTSENPNVYSAIENISVYQVVNVPDYPIDKCNVIRAVAISPLGFASEVSCASYFVGLEKSHYEGCRVVSIVTDPENLFDHHKGIYVLGQIFADYSVNGDTERYPFYWSANYNQRGPEWEREALLQFFDKDGSLMLEKEGGIRIRGGTTRAWGKKGFNLFCRPEYDGTQSFEIPFYDSGYIPDSVSLMTGGNQPIIQFHDYAMNTLARPLDVVTALYEPYILFIDGEYWGFYWMSEKFDENFFEYYYNTAADNVVMIKNKAVEVGQDKDILLYENMMDFVENSDMSLEKNYRKACSMIDMESCIDYYASMIYIARCNDWPHYNVAMWRSREATDDSYADGRWRFVIFDCNSASMGVPSDAGPAHNTLEFSLEKSEFFKSLWANGEFRSDFEERIMYISDNIFEKEAVHSFTDSFAQTMYPVLQENWNRFYTTENDKSALFETSMEDIKSFFEQRKGYVEGWFEN